MQSRPKPYLIPPGASPDTRYQCKRCNRHLPDFSFPRLLWYENSTDVLSRRQINAISPVCKVCRDQMNGRHTEHPLYTKSTDRFFQKLMSSVKGGARTRGLAVLVDKDDLLGLYLEQEGRCAMTGVLMVLDSGGNKAKNRVRPSVDRIDSAGNYTVDNIQLICSQVNIMKAGMSQVDFLRWCNKVVSYRGAAEDNILAAVS